MIRCHMELAYIYTLADPRDDIPKYVGKTFSPKKRLNDHVYEHTSKNSSRKISWIKSLRKDGLKPKMEILEVLTNAIHEEWDLCEQQWIEHLRFYGFKLKNGDSGGNTGKRLSEEARAKIAIRSSQHRHKESSKQLISMASKANMTPEAKANLSKFFKGRKTHSEKFKQMMRDLKSGIPRPDHVKEARDAGREKWKEENDIRTDRRCVGCGIIIKYNFLKNGIRVPDLHFFTDGIGYAHNKCKKLILLQRQ